MKPPDEPLGRSIAVTFSVHFRSPGERRDRWEVDDTGGRWCVRYARRAFPGYAVEGWSASFMRGQTYVDYWFGTVEVYLRRRIAVAPATVYDAEP